MGKERVVLFTKFFFSFIFFLLYVIVEIVFFFRTESFEIINCVLCCFVLILACLGKSYLLQDMCAFLIELYLPTNPKTGRDTMNY